MNVTDEQANIKIALITGANRGLGFATARLLGNEGALVLVGSRSESRGVEAAERLRRGGVDARPVQIDVTSAASVHSAAAHIGDDYGRLDVLVNNAGILPEATATDMERPLDMRRIRETFDTNVFGAARVTQAFLPLLKKSSAGRIVNVSSTMGSLTDQLNPQSPYYGLVVPAYQASKAALNALTIALSKVLADSAITVNSICPGWVQTDLGGSDNRAAAPTSADEAAEIVVRTALSEDGSFSGQFVDINGRVPW